MQIVGYFYHYIIKQQFAILLIMEILSLLLFLVSNVFVGADMLNYINIILPVQEHFHCSSIRFTERQLEGKSTSNFSSETLSIIYRLEIFKP